MRRSRKSIAAFRLRQFLLQLAQCGLQIFHLCLLIADLLGKALVELAIAVLVAGDRLAGGRDGRLVAARRNRRARIEEVLEKSKTLRPDGDETDPERLKKWLEEVNPEELGKYRM